MPVFSNNTSLEVFSGCSGPVLEGIGVCKEAGELGVQLWVWSMAWELWQLQVAGIE